MRLFGSLDTFYVTKDRAFQQNIGDEAVGSDGGVFARLYSQFRLELGITRAGEPNTIDIGSSISGEWLLKLNSGTQKYDAPIVISTNTFTRASETNPGNAGTDYFYVANLDLTQPSIEKLLGVNYADVKEGFTVAAVADVSGSLNNQYLDLYTTASAYDRVWFNVASGGTAPAAGTGGTLRVVALSTNASATTVAAAIATLYTADANFTVTALTGTATFQRKTAVVLGWHHPRGSGFTITLTAAGAVAGAVANADSAELLSELSFLYSSQRQILEPFLLIVENSVRRPGTNYPGTVASVSYAPDTTADYTWTGTNTFGILKFGAEDSLTAFAGGGQGSALALTANKKFHRISTCATAADSVKLPAATVGDSHFIRNDGANACQVFGTGTDTINGVAYATGVSQGAGVGTWFICTTAGAWTSTALTAGATPGGSTTQVQYNLAGVLAGSSSFTFDAINGLVIAGQVMPTLASFSGTTLAMTASSGGTQRFTGSAATVVTLPTTSVVAGQSWRIINDGTAIMTINSSGSNRVQVVGIGQETTITALQATPTTAAHWKASFVQHRLEAYLAADTTHTSVSSVVPEFLPNMTAGIDTAGGWTTPSDVLLAHAAFTNGTTGFVVDGAGPTTPPTGLVVGMPITGTGVGVGAYVTAIGSTSGSRTSLTANTNFTVTKVSGDNITLTAKRQYYLAPITGKIKVGATVYFGDLGTGSAGAAGAYYGVDSDFYSLGSAMMCGNASGFTDNAAVGGDAAISVTEGQKVWLGFAAPAPAWPILSVDATLSSGARATRFHIEYVP